MGHCLNHKQADIPGPNVMFADYTKQAPSRSGQKNVSTVHSTKLNEPTYKHHFRAKYRLTIDVPHGLPHINHTACTPLSLLRSQSKLRREARGERRVIAANCPMECSNQLLFSDCRSGKGMYVPILFLLASISYHTI